MTVNLLDLDLENLAVFCDQLGEKRFRAVQLFRWIHQRGCANFADMSDLAKSLRDKLAGVAFVKGLNVVSQHISADGTIKWLFDVGAGNAIETVFIPKTIAVPYASPPRLDARWRADFAQPDTKGSVAI